LRYGLRTVTKTNKNTTAVSAVGTKVAKMAARLFALPPLLEACAIVAKKFDKCMFTKNVEVKAFKPLLGRNSL